MNEEAKAH